MLSLTAGASSIVVAPEHGAGLVGWMRGRTALLRHALPEAAAFGDSHAMGLFPLLPYCNRIGWTRFSWQGRGFPPGGQFGGFPPTTPPTRREPDRGVAQGPPSSL